MPEVLKDKLLMSKKIKKTHQMIVEEGRGLHYVDPSMEQKFQKEDLEEHLEAGDRLFLKHSTKN